jgi:hypothetical protein
MFHDGAENRRLEVLPVGTILGDGDEVVAEEDAGNAGNTEQLGGERRSAPASSASRKSAVPLIHHHLAGQELQGRGVGRGFGLNEHCGLLPGQ